mgnify:CR=1 FL=1
MKLLHLARETLRQARRGTPLAIAGAATVLALTTASPRALAAESNYTPN